MLGRFRPPSFRPQRGKTALPCSLDDSIRILAEYGASLHALPACGVEVRGVDTTKRIDPKLAGALSPVVYARCCVYCTLLCVLYGAVYTVRCCVYCTVLSVRCRPLYVRCCTYAIPVLLYVRCYVCCMTDAM